MFRTIFEMQPRDAGPSGGASMSKEEKVINNYLKNLLILLTFIIIEILLYNLYVYIIILQLKTIIDDIMDKAPEEFNLPEIMAKIEDKTPYILVAFQELERMNILFKEIKRSLKELDLGLKVRYHSCSFSFISIS